MHIKSSCEVSFLSKTLTSPLFPGTVWMEATVQPLQKIQTGLFSQVQPDVHDLSQLSCSSCRMTHFPLMPWTCFSAFQPATFQSEAFKSKAQGSLILWVNKGVGGGPIFNTESGNHIKRPFGCPWAISPEDRLALLLQDSLNVASIEKLSLYWMCDESHTVQSQTCSLLLYV